MGTRRFARELAMQALFSMDMNSAFSPEMLADYRSCFPLNKRVGPYFERLTGGVLQYKNHIDKVIEQLESPPDGLRGPQCPASGGVRAIVLRRHPS
jgi:transcription termination factor NusB